MQSVMPVATTEADAHANTSNCLPLYSVHCSNIELDAHTDKTMHAIYIHIDLWTKHNF